MTNLDCLEAFLLRQADSCIATSMWLNFGKIDVYLRAGKLVSYRGLNRLLGVCISNVSVHEGFRRQGIFSNFVSCLTELSRNLGYTEFQIEVVVSPEMLAYCKKHNMNRKQYAFGDISPSFWLPLQR